jgi:integrase
MKYVKKRGAHYHFVRRVPKEIKHIDERDYIQLSLKTDSPSVAQQRANELNQQINIYWQSLVENEASLNIDKEARFKQAVQLARLHGFSYKSTNEIVTSSIEEVVERVLLASQYINEPKHVEALLGGLNQPKVILSSALETFWALNKDTWLNKSENQIKKWKNPRIKAIRNFIEVVGDKPLSDLNRNDVLDFKDWWVTKLKEEGKTPNSANKDFTHLRGILMTVNDNLRLDLPILKLFERLTIKEVPRTGRLSFEPKFVQNTLLLRQSDKPTIMSGMSYDLWLFVCAMADTGARINELAGLEPENGDISLSGDIPFINIRPNNTRQLKTPSSKRLIPLVGSSLFAFKQLPKGFEKYRHTPDTLSSTINKWFRENNALPSENHSLYSLRHCFQDRLTKIEAPDKIQAELMGHKFYRPKYGSGASLEQKQKWLNQIAFEA